MTLRDIKNYRLEDGEKLDNIPTADLTGQAGKILSVKPTEDGFEFAEVGTGDMLKSVYDTNNSGVVDNSELVNGLTVETAVPTGAVFTDTTYTDAEIKTKYENNVDTNAYTDAEKTKLTNIEDGAEVNNISDINATDLTDGLDSTLHYHSTDRDRTNHTGEQAISTITDLQTTLDGKANLVGGNTFSGLQLLDTTQIGGEFIEVNIGGSGDRNSYIDFHSQDGTDRDARIIRKPGADGILEISNTGNGRIDFVNYGYDMSILDNGNVGIGTTTPSEKLDVSGNIELNGYLKINGGAGYIGGWGASLDVKRLTLDTNSTGDIGGEIRFFRDTNSTGYKAIVFFKGDGTTASEHKLGVGGTDSYLAIDGKLGIGTNTPTKKLDIIGDIYQHNYADLLEIRINNTADRGRIGFNLDRGASGKDNSGIHFLTGGNEDWHIGQKYDLGGVTTEYFGIGTSYLLRDDHIRFHKVGRIQIFNLPTSSTGLSSGDIWNDNGTLKIV